MARPTVFVDTGALFARYRRSDEHHQRAIEGWSLIEQGEAACITTSLVLAEAASLLIRWSGAALAAPRIRTWFESDVLEIVRDDEELELQALSLLEKFADQNPSFIDCTSFALMKRRRLSRAFTFDKHFAITGFELWPPRK